MEKEKKPLRAAKILAAALLLVLGILAFFRLDLSAPRLVLVDAYETACGKEISVYDLIQSVEDQSSVELTLAGEGQVAQNRKFITFSHAGQFPVEVTALDHNGNQKSETITVTVKDSTPPELTAKTITSYVGETIDYSAACTAEDDVDGDLSSQVRVDDAAVDINTPGTYKVTYRVLDRSGNEAICTGMVTVQRLPASAISLDRTKAHLGGNEYVQLHAEVDPADWEGTVSWSSSDESVATVSDGLVYWQGKGECTITAAADEATAKCKVTCGAVAPTSLELSLHKLTLDEGESRQLNWGVLPSNWSGSVTWESSDESVALVQDGEVIWAGKGTCTITAYASDQVYDSCVVTCKGGFQLGDVLNDMFGRQQAEGDVQGTTDTEDQRDAEEGQTNDEVNGAGGTRREND